jgi:hypothetical protein
VCCEGQHLSVHGLVHGLVQQQWLVLMFKPLVFSIDLARQRLAA